MLRPMMISVLPVDSSTKSPIVIIKEVDWERRLPIWIGILEASAIASELESLWPPKVSKNISKILSNPKIRPNLTATRRLPIY